MPQREKPNREDADPFAKFCATRSLNRGRTTARFDSVQSAGDQLGTIARGCEIFAITTGAYSLIDVLTHCLDHTGPATVDLATWTAAAADLGFANKMLGDGRIERMRWVVDFSFVNRQPDYCAAMREAFGDDCIRVTKTHAKFAVIRNKRWNLAIRSSMNLNLNKRIETVEISDDARIADALTNFTDWIFAQTDTETDLARSPGEHVKRYDEIFGTDPDAEDTQKKKYFSEAAYGRDLRRIGLTRR